MAFSLPPLPYAENALEPYISEKTLQFHHKKHHQTYVTNLNAILEEKGLASDCLETLIQQSFQNPDQGGIFNNAAQVWNHSFYWKCMKPQAGGIPTGILAEHIDRDFGDFASFSQAFTQAALSQFGSGWAWLVLDKGTLKVTKTPNADLPLVHGQTALLTCDVWEHAYYLDYQNRRVTYVETFLKHLVDWDFVTQCFNAAKV